MASKGEACDAVSCGAPAVTKPAHHIRAGHEFEVPGEFTFPLGLGKQGMQSKSGMHFPSPPLRRAQHGVLTAFIFCRSE